MVLRCYQQLYLYVLSDTETLSFRPGLSELRSDVHIHPALGRDRDMFFKTKKKFLWFYVSVC
jgi:hypothetical protein